MQDVGGDDQVDRMGIESLLERVVLDVERPVLHERKLAEFVFRMRQEARRNIGEHIFGTMFWQHGKDEARHASCTAADLEKSQRLSLRQMANDLGNCLLQQQIVQTKAWRVLVEMLRGR